MPTKLKGKKPQETKPGHFKANIFAESGVGKTWLSLMFPQPYFIDSEGGARLAHYQERLKSSGGAYFGPEDGGSDPATVLAEIRALSTETHPYKTLVIDSLSKIYNTIITKEAERLGDRDAFGASKRPAVAFVRQLINALDKLEMNVFIICHEKPKWAEGAQAGYEENMWEGLRYELDITLRLLRQGPKRMAKVCKSRLTGFPDGDLFEATYEEIVKRYGKDFIEAPSVPVEMASPEDVTEVERILAILKIEEKEIQKWHSSAKADSFSEYRKEHITKLIEHLKGKIK